MRLTGFFAIGMLGAIGAVVTGCEGIETGAPQVQVRYEPIPLPAAGPEDGALQHVWLFGPDQSTRVLVYENALVFPNGERIALGGSGHGWPQPLPRVDDPSVIAVDHMARRFERGVVVFTRRWTGNASSSSTFRYYDLEGRPGAEGSGLGIVTDGGAILWDDYGFNRASRFALVLPDGTRLPETKPWEIGFHRVLSDSSAERIAVFLSPSRPEQGGGRLYLYDASGNVLVEKDVDYETFDQPSVSWIGLTDRYVLLKHDDRMGSESVWFIQVLTLDGEHVVAIEGGINGMEVRGEAVVIHRDLRSVRDQARFELPEGKTSWSATYEERYSRPRLAPFEDRPDQEPLFFPRRFASSALLDGQVVAFVVSQGLYGKRTKHGEDELLFVATGSGDVLARFALGQRPKVLRTESHGDRLYVLRDGEYGVYVLASESD